MEENKKLSSRSLKGTWTQALVGFLSPLVIFFSIRWIGVEPFVIPSESMVPNLLIHDHILVTKFSYGLKVPFTDMWLLRWGKPEAGDIVVFKYPANPKLYYVKRVIGVPGDVLKIDRGRITKNAIPYKNTSTSLKKNLYIEDNGNKKYIVQFVFNFEQVEVSNDTSDSDNQMIKVPDGKYFMMGDNRDASSDSRVWGFVPEENLVGRAWLIWLSCEDTMSDVSFLCDPLKMRWNRWFKTLH